MEGPSFQNFEKEKILNPLAKRHSNQKQPLSNERQYINKEDSSTDNLIVNRTPEIMETHVFQIIHKDLSEKQLRNIISYIKNILKIEKEKQVEINTIGEFDNTIYNKDTVFIFNQSSVKNQEVTGSDVTSLMMKSAFQNAGGIIFISNHINDVPKFICTTSQLVFIQKEVEDLQTTLEITAGIRLRQIPILDIDMICIDKFSLWTRICNFNKIN